MENGSEKANQSGRKRLNAVGASGGLSAGMSLDVPRSAGAHSMIYFSTRLYWNKKIKIAILALATFAAMC